MSAQLTANNVVRNGTFADREANWNATATAPGKVDFSGQNCVISAPGRAEQSVPMAGTRSYTFSVFTLITYNGSGSALLVFQPSGASASIGLAGNHGWVRRSTSFSTPAGTTSATIQLNGDAGDVWFDNVRLVEDGGSTIPIELVRNGKFTENSDEWTTSLGATFHGEQCQLNNGNTIEQEISVVPGQTYNFAIDAMTPTGGHGFVNFQIAPDDTRELELRGSGGWDTYPYELAIPAGITEFTLQVVGATFLVVDNLTLTSAP